MKKRLLAFFCMLALLLSCFPGGMTAKAAEERYQVGYAIKDMNPWVDYEDHSKGIQAGLFNLTGNQNDDERPLEQLFDDNNDGVRGEGDGIYTTATAVTDPAGKTIIYITIDSLQGYSAITSDVRTAIVEQLGSNVIARDQIMVNGSHSHSSAPFSSLRNKAGAKGVYYNYVISQITAAAVEAFNDRAPADMSKGTVDAKDATAAMGYNGGQGYHMNANRHYETTMTNKNNTSEKKSYMTWSGDTLDKQSEYPFVTSGNNKKKNLPTEESNNDMHVLLFRFPDNADKEPVVLVNWRAHTTMNSGIEKKSLSSDYVNGLRTTLAKNGYRAAFLQGAAGSVVTTAKDSVWWAYPEYKDWQNQVDEELAQAGVTVNSTNRKAKQTFTYGRILAEIAMYCIENSGKMEALPAGMIRNIQVVWRGEIQPYTEGHLEAAKETKTIEALGGTIEYPFRYEYEGETYILNSNYHRNAIITRSNASASFTDLELNAITFGKEVAFVTAPNELADKFHVYQGNEKYSDNLNDWNNLIDEATYGTPFVLGYTNDGRGYIAGWLDHQMNSQTFTDITGFAENGEEFFDPGTYESNTSRLAAGQGEALLAKMGEMLDHLKNNYRVDYCEACQTTAEWEPILVSQAGAPMSTGHYYLYEDVPVETTNSNRFNISNGANICLDLNGRKVETASRSLIIKGEGTVVNLFDSVGSGQLISYSGGNNVGGGAVNISDKAVLNIYGGTIQFIRNPIPGKYETGNGAVIYCSSTVNMYGGTLIGGELMKSTYYPSTNTGNGCGGTVYLISGKFNVSGGRIIAGKAADGARGDCVYLHDAASRMTISGDAQIDEIYLNYNSSNLLTIKGTYTGQTAINVNSTPKLGAKVAKLSSADIKGANLTYSGNSEYMLKASGSYLVTAERTSGVAVVYDNYTATAYDDLNVALRNAGDGLVTMLKPVTADVAVSGDASLDLNGNSITGKVTVADGKTLYCMDSETDDYDVADNKYGRISQIIGTVKPVEEESDLAADGYLMVSEEDGTSFHRVNLQLTAMTLRAEQAGLYYKSNFAGDQVVARHVDTFGVALSVKEVPEADNLETLCKYSWFDNFQSGENGNLNENTSTLLKNVMKPTNSDFMNNGNASKLIFGRAYVKLNDGTYLFGAHAARTFRQQVEDVNDILKSLTPEQKTAVKDMCGAYIDVVRGWAISDILLATATEDEILKIFAIGNSYTVDSMHLLREVYQAENPDKQVVLGYAYNGGCTLSEHVQYINANDDAYTFYQVDKDGVHTSASKKTMKEMLLTDNWDIVMLQQGSSESGLAETYNSNITTIYNYASKTLCYTPEYGWNMTWAYPGRTSSNSAGFDNYGSQEAMFDGIVYAVQNEIVTDETIKYLMPVGLAVQNARTKYTESADLHRDGYGHLNDFARLMAAYVWYCELEGVTLESIKMNTIPAALTKSYTEGDLVLTEEQMQVLIQCVNNALASKLDGTFAVIPVT